MAGLVLFTFAQPVTAQRIYWSEEQRNGDLTTIRRANVNGTELEVLLEKPVDCPVGIDADPITGRLFWAECNSIRVASMDGSKSARLVDTGARVLGLALDRKNKRLYWTTTSPPNWQGVIRSALLDGSNIIDVLTTGPLSPDVAIDPVNRAIYWFGPGTIESADLDGANVHTVATTEYFVPQALAFDEVGQLLFWSSDYPWATLHRCNSDGTDCVEIASLEFGTYFEINGLTYDAGSSKLYWSTGENLYRLDKDGENFEELDQPATRVAIVADRLFMTSEPTETIRRAELDGSNAVSLVASPFGRVNAIALDVTENRMYWADPFLTGRIVRSRLDGSEIETVLCTGLYSVGDLAVDSVAGKLYWTQDRSGNDAKVRRSNLDGTDAEDVVTVNPSGPRNMIQPRGIALDVSADMIYWTDVGTDDVKRARRDGSGMETIATTGSLGDPQRVALDPVHTNVYWTEGAGVLPNPKARIATTKLEGGPVVTAIATASLHSGSFPIGIAIDIERQRMYWTDFYARKIQTVHLPPSTQKVTDVVSDSVGPYAMALDSRVTGDCSGDGSVNETDFDDWAECLFGPGTLVPNPCLCADVTGNARVDLRDFAVLQRAPEIAE